MVSVFLLLLKMMCVLAMLSLMVIEMKMLHRYVTVNTIVIAISLTALHSSI